MHLKKNKTVLKGSLAASTIIFIICSLLILLASNTPAYGTETSINRVTGVNTGVYFYVRIEGASQGVILGNVQTSGFQGWIEGYQYSHSMYYPTDPHSGAVTGQRVHTPVIILKEVDKSTPKLSQAFVTGEKLNEVLIRFFNQSSYNYFTVKLEDATINSIREFMPNNLNPSTYQPLMEEISLVYRRITWTWEEEGIEFTDDWYFPG
ncbi:MAG: type VI secretion system tube protein TssD [Candidatus Hodarchaeota archaeon]